MKKVLSPCFALLALLSVGACTRHIPPSPLTTPGTSLVAKVDSLGLPEFLALPAAERERRRAIAREDLWHYEEWTRRLELFMRQGSQDGMWAFELLDGSEGRRTEKRMDDLIPRLHRAVNTDPANVAAAYGLGRLLAIVGDWDRACSALLLAWEALPHDPDAASAASLRGDVALENAWLCYETGRLEAGHVWLERGADAWDEEQAHAALLVEGLLHAAQGHFAEADRIAMTMPPFKYARRGVAASGHAVVPSGYANRWLKAMAWLGAGDPERAYFALRPVYEQRGQLPHGDRYWHDVALVCELSGHVEEANGHYGKALLSHFPELVYFPHHGYSSNALIHGLPDLRIPYWTSWHDHYLAGSLFSYAARLIDDACFEDDPARLESLRRGAVKVLDICVARGIHVDEARALRGWVLYDLGELGAARRDLVLARAAFTAADDGDATTSLLIGTLVLNDQQPAEALPYLQEAVRLDPGYGTAWRTCGAALATLRRFQEAEAAMDRGLEIDPFAASGWYNRGLMSMNLQRWRDGYADLAVASRLDPGNADIEQMLELARRNWLKESGETGPATADARADSLAGALRSGTPLLAWPARPVVPTAHAVRIADVDHVACADSLSLAFTLAPDDTLRLRLAGESLLAGLPEQTLALLEAEWRGGLTLPEQHLVLRADRALGLVDRAQALAAGLLGGEPPCADATLWSLVAACCLDGGLRREGLAALDRAIYLDPTNHALTSFRKLVHRLDAP